MFKRMDSFGVFDYIETSEGTYEYSAEKMREQFAGLVGNGVLKGIGDQFNASSAGLQVTIGTGEGWLLGVHGKMITTSPFTLDPVVSGMSKICSVVLDVDIPNQLFGISVLEGTQAAAPSAPQISQSETRYQQLIWQAHVYDDGTITLTDFRTYLIRPGDGTTPEIIGAAKRSYTAIYTLLASGWASRRYTITSAMLDIISHVESADTPVHIGFPAGTTLAQRQALQSANIFPYAQSAESITIEADGAVPTINCPVTIVVEGGVYDE